MPFFTSAELEALWLSVRVAASSTAVALPFAVLMAWVLSRCRFPGRALLDGIVHLPLVMPPVVVGYLLLITLGARGPVGAWLDRWFGIQLVFTTTGASIAAGVMSFPLMVRTIRLGLEAVDRGLEDAARTLGASRLDAFVTITLPLMVPGIVAGMVVAFAAALGEFGATITFVSNIPGETRTLPLAIYTATQTPDGDAAAARLAGLAFGFALAALMASEWLARRVQRWIGRA
ncbi:MAG TPA: molybdate ABC transporter permease subunit [Burkholderiaceae bacterium]|nr:molybdate ABC transporter permease subunit [Burkholderiaceae bacterium]